MSGGTHFPRKFCPTGQEILSASRIICPGLGGKSVRQENVSRPDLVWRSQTRGARIARRVWSVTQAVLVKDPQ